MINKFIIAIGLMSLLTACGGGSGSSSPKTNTNTDTKTETVIALDHAGLPIIDPLIAENAEYLAGGEATTTLSNSEAFEQRPDLIASDFAKDANFTSGDHIFRTAHEGAGPLMNAASCQGCHLKDGRGFVPANKDIAMETMFLRISDAQGNNDPMYGDQLQTFAVQSFVTSDRRAGLPVANGSLNGDALYGEAYAYIEYETIEGEFDDGESYQLRQPIYYIKDLSFGEFNDSVRFSPRVTPSIFGSGLLEAIPQAHIEALADENDANNDGISGRISVVNEHLTAEDKLGRFGYKATNPSVLQQSAGAYRGDMGITNSLFTEEPCTEQQVACQVVAEQEVTTAEQVDITDRELALVEFYTRVLAVPARRGFDEDSQTWNDEVIAGRRLFFSSDCASCHTPRHVTGIATGSLLGEVSLSGLTPEAEDIAVLSNQTIFPYTDLLLHDMGGSCVVSRTLADGNSCTEGDNCLYVQRCEGLADDRPEGQATGTEWKTPALWGLGLVQTVNPKATFLHDGRARDINEAILWHGGEAQASKAKYLAMSKAERDNLLVFLNSL